MELATRLASPGKPFFSFSGWPDGAYHVHDCSRAAFIMSFFVRKVFFSREGGTSFPDTCASGVDVLALVMRFCVKLLLEQATGGLTQRILLGVRSQLLSAQSCVSVVWVLGMTVNCSHECTLPFFNEVREAGWRCSSSA